MLPSGVIHNPENRDSILADVYMVDGGLKYDFRDCLLRQDKTYVNEAIKVIREICEDVNSTCKVVKEGNSLIVYASNPNYSSKWGKLKMILFYAYRSLKRAIGMQKQAGDPRRRQPKCII